MIRLPLFVLIFSILALQGHQYSHEPTSDDQHISIQCQICFSGLSRQVFENPKDHISFSDPLFEPIFKASHQLIFPYLGVENANGRDPPA